MKDKNGNEIKTGMIVKISNAYFKNDNGLYYVERSPGDPSWRGKDHSLRKISKTGKISTAKRNICFWPIFVTVSDRAKNADAEKWNEEHAEIELSQVTSTAEVKAHFLQEAANLEKAIQRAVWDFGEDSEIVKNYRTQKTYIENVACAM